jgi:hypothetical protein
MKRFTEKFWFLTAALCLLVAFSTFVAVAGNHPISEESSVELVDIVEAIESIADSGQRRVERKYSVANFLYSHPTNEGKRLAGCRFFKPASERDNLNGLGGYLRT